jgi:hypothetical protein
LGGSPHDQYTVQNVRTFGRILFQEITKNDRKKVYRKIITVVREIKEKRRNEKN